MEGKIIMPMSIDEMVRRHLETLPKPKPLPQILNEMDDNIRAAAEAARKAEEAATLGRQAAVAATKASVEAAKRAEEARIAGKEVAEAAICAANKAAATAEETAKAARLAAEQAAEKAEEANEIARKAAKAFREATKNAATKAGKASSRAIKASEAVLQRIESLEQRLRDVEESISREAVVVIREISREEAKTEIERLFQDGKVLYYSDIARQLRIDLELAVDICEELSKEGKVRVADNP
jgi:hypothetical protein